MHFSSLNLAPFLRNQQAFPLLQLYFVNLFLYSHSKTQKPRLDLPLVVKGHTTLLWNIMECLHAHKYIDAHQSPSWLPYTQPHSELTNSSSPAQKPSLPLSLCWFLHWNYFLFSLHSRSRYLCLPCSVIAFYLTINCVYSCVPMSSQLIEIMIDLYVPQSSFSDTFYQDPEKKMNFTLRSNTYRTTCTQRDTYAHTIESKVFLKQYFNYKWTIYFCWSYHNPLIWFMINYVTQ